MKTEAPKVVIDSEKQRQWSAAFSTMHFQLTWSSILSGGFASSMYAKYLTQRPAPDLQVGSVEYTILTVISIVSALLLLMSLRTVSLPTQLSLARRLSRRSPSSSPHDPNASSTSDLLRQSWSARAYVDAGFATIACGIALLVVMTFLLVRRYWFGEEAPRRSHGVLVIPWFAIAFSFLCGYMGILAGKRVYLIQRSSA
jgi:hypothetical protein